MGIDYLRMRPKPHASRATLISLIESQTTAFRGSGHGRTSWVEAYDLPRVPEDDPVHQQYRDASDTLWSYIDVDDWCEGMDFYVSFRVYPITRNNIFPIEWQQTAYRTYLPDQLPTQLATWRGYLNAVRQGSYRAYLLRRYLYEFSRDLFQGWAYMREYAQLSRTRTNAWTLKPAFVKARDIVESFPPPPLYPAPLWLYWQHTTKAETADIAQQYADLQQYGQALADLNRAWDRRVPNRWKQRGYTYGGLQTFETFLDLANDDWLEEFCTWVGHCCEENMGLFLYY